MPDSKLTTHILYICRHYGGPDLDVRKIHKALWFADTTAISKGIGSFTGARYIKQQSGPAVEGLEDTLEALEHAGQLQCSSGTGTRYYTTPDTDTAADAPDTHADDHITPQQRKILDHIGRALTGMDLPTISNITHDAYWDSLQVGDEMLPKHSSIAQWIGTPPSPETLEQAKLIAAQLSNQSC